MQRKDELKALEVHSGWKIYTQYLGELLVLDNQNLINSHMRDGKDISDYLRGRISAYAELLNLGTSIKTITELINQVQQDENKVESKVS